MSGMRCGLYHDQVRTSSRPPLMSANVYVNQIILNWIWRLGVLIKGMWEMIKCNIQLRLWFIYSSLECFEFNNITCLVSICGVKRLSCDCETFPYLDYVDSDKACSIFWQQSLQCLSTIRKHMIHCWETCETKVSTLPCKESKLGEIKLVCPEETRPGLTVVCLVLFLWDQE